MFERSRHLGMGMRIAKGPSELDRFIAFSGDFFFVTLPYRFSKQLVKVARLNGVACADARIDDALFPLQGATAKCSVAQFTSILQMYLDSHGLKRTQVCAFQRPIGLRPLPSNLLTCLLLLLCASLAYNSSFFVSPHLPLPV